MLLRKLIIFLVRKKLGLRKLQMFRFDNQNSYQVRYYFDSLYLYKIVYRPGKPITYKRLSEVSLNYLLSDKCKITKFNILERSKFKC